MLKNCYRFLDRWRVEAAPEEVFRIMEDWSQMPRWWPAVVLKADILDPGDADGIGGIVQLCTRGWLSYVIQTQVETVEKAFPHRIRTRTGGQLRGDATWTFQADGPYVDMVFKLTVTAEQPVIKYFSFALWPVFAWNHRWSMRRGEEGIRLEVARRRAQADEERPIVPALGIPISLSQRMPFRLPI